MFKRQIHQLVQTSFWMSSNVCMRSWWKDLYNSVKLSYARDRIVENYFWTCGIYHEEEYSRARIMFTKVFGLMSLMDDTYDAHATLEECHKLNKAIQR